MVKHKLKVNQYNLALCLIIILAAAYIGLLSSNQPYTKPVSYSETALPVSVSSGFSPANLNHDLQLVKEAIDQSSQDQKFLNSGLKYQQQSTASKELAQRINIASLAISQLNAARELGTKTRSALKNQAYDFMRPLLGYESNPWNAVAAKRGLSNSYNAFIFFVKGVELIKLSDDQQVAARLLQNMTPEINSAIKLIGSKGLSTADLYADMTTLTSDISQASTISAGAEDQIIGHQAGLNLKTIDTSLDTSNLDILIAYKTASTIVRLIASASA